MRSLKLSVAAALCSVASVYAAFEYQIHQQFNDMCMIAPMLNLPRLLNELGCVVFESWHGAFLDSIYRRERRSP